MSDKKEKTIVAIQIELPTQFVVQLPPEFWPRLCITVSDILRLNEPKDSEFFPLVWKAD